MGITAGTSVSVLSRSRATSSTVRVQDGAVLTGSDRLVSTVGLLGKERIRIRVEMWDKDSGFLFNQSTQEVDEYVSKTRNI